MDLKGSRKRKSCVGEEEDEEDEERKMEKFLDLIQNLRESRERLMREQSKRRETRIEKNKGAYCGWEPRFEVQDFAQDQEAVATLKAFHDRGKAPPHTQQQRTPTPTPTALDLSLSL